LGVQDGVHLFSRVSPTLNAFEVRAERTLSFPAQLIYEVVTDYGRYQEFMPGIVSATLFQVTNTNELDVYMRYSPQFVVVRARDVELQVTLQPGLESQATWRSAWKNITGRAPERSDSVRMPLNVGSWSISPISANSSRIVYQVAVRPGGWIPDWMVRWGAARALPEVIQIVERRVATLMARPNLPRH
jgi:hypothetical protein